VRDDTIAAIATPPGQGGIGIVRVSGAKAREIGERVFRGRLRDRGAVFGQVWDRETGYVVDEALGLLMLAPRTYTREDTLELQAHGGTAVLQRILGLTLREGARAAEPGEFTLRAFMNGRLDLAQAEAVLDVIEAQTDTALRLAVDGLGGRLSTTIRAVRSKLLDLLAYLSARADFPDEDVPVGDVQPVLTDAIATIDALLATADYGMVHRQGIHVTIAGSPNAGKSSLMNRLLREDRAIVTSIPGTTRDTVSEGLNLGGVPIVLTDTAGLWTTVDNVEILGMERSRQEITKCDLLLIVLENGRPLNQEECTLLHETAAKPRVIVLNKIDLGTLKEPNLIDLPLIQVSALTGEKLPELEQSIVAAITHGTIISSDTPTVTNARHKSALEGARDSLTHAQKALDSSLPEDFACSDVRAAVAALGEITGETITDELLDSIFRNFCIGK
jgi:tRNA modification GTPase